MEKPLLTALLFLCMRLPLFARQPVPAPPAPALTDTSAPIRTALVLPSPHTPIGPAGTPTRIPVSLRVFNNAFSGNLSDIVLDWELLVNGVIRQKGSVAQLLIAPQHAGLIRLPVKIPPGAGDEMFLHLRYRSRRPGSTIPAGRKTNSPLPAGRLIAEQQLLLTAWGNNLSVVPIGELSFTDESGIFTIQSPATRLRFDKQTGWLQQYEDKGLRLLEDTPGLRSDLWPDPADAPRLQLFSTSTGTGIVIVRAEYILPVTACHLHLSYTVNSAGEILVEQSMEADSAQQGWLLPRFGMQWVLPPGFDSVTGYGPSALSATDIGIYRQTTGEPGSPEKTAIRWWKITGRDGRGLQITADSSLLNISAAPLAGNSANGAATPPTQLKIGYPPYGLPSGNYRYAFKITPISPGP
jgi:beta-galactosidase